MKYLFLNHYYIFLFAYSFLTTCALLACFYFFKRIKKNLLGLKFCFALSSLAYVFILSEGFFAYFMVQSDGFGFTLSSQRWFSKYWHPINDYGYRDNNPIWKEKKLFVVGDSFIAGQGVKNIDHRISNRLAEKMGKEWSVTSLAKNGWGPNDYFKAIDEHDQKANIIIISLFKNDILDAAKEHRIGVNGIQDKPNDLFNLFINHSYTLNYLYWRIYRNNLGANSFNLSIDKLYSNKHVLNTYHGHLMQISNFCKTHNIRLIFLIWPDLRKVKESHDFTNKLETFIKENQHETINLTSELELFSPNDLIVNSLDAHPNASTHAKVAEILYQYLYPKKE